jgi:hypothetical protein
MILETIKLGRYETGETIILFIYTIMAGVIECTIFRMVMDKSEFESSCDPQPCFLLLFHFFIRFYMSTLLVVSSNAEA